MLSVGTMNNDLTVVLTLKGRHLHTLRWLWHANRTRLPFHVIVADGEVNPAIDRLLSDPVTFPDLSFEYHRYDDKCISDYYRKLALSLGQVRTKYVVLSDNDDFLLPYGMNRSVKFLDAAPGYVCAGAGIPGFSLDTGSSEIPNVVGNISHLKDRYISNRWYFCRDIDDSSALLRMMKELVDPLAVHYYVHRTKVLHAIAKEVHEFNPVVRLCELYFALRIVTEGKVRSDPSHFNYLRQQGTSQNNGTGTDYVDDSLRSTFTKDFERFAANIAAKVSGVHEMTQSDVEECIYEVYAANLRVDLATTLMRYRFPRLFAVKQFLHGLPRPGLPTKLKRRMDLRKLWRRLAADGGDPDAIAAHAAEIGEIEATLQGDAFTQFVSVKAPELLAGS
jgi:glycosyltransferase domain-containing protein